MRLLFFALAITALSAARPDPYEIVKRSIQATDQSARLLSRYTYRERDEHREFDAAGRITVEHTTFREVLFIGGKPYRHTLEKDGKPLPPDEEKREQAKLDRAVADAKKLTPEERIRREQDYVQQRVKERERLKYVPEAFQLKLLEDAVIDGRPAYVIQATPRLSYQGKYSSLFHNFEGKMFIDKQDYRWVRVEADALDNVSFGLILARLSKGARIEFEQTRVNNEVWLPKSLYARGDARLLLVKSVRLEERVVYSDYRKFDADSHVTSVTEDKQ